jgi:hypothetical protein
MGRWIHTHIRRQHGNPISHLLFLQNKENRLKIIYLYGMWVGSKKERNY